MEKRSRKRKKKPLNVLFKILILIILAVVIFEIVLNFLIKKPTYISPLASKNFQLKKSEDSMTQKAIDLLNKDKIIFSEVLASESAIIIKLPENGDVILASDKPIDNQISSLQLILTRLTIEGKRFVKIDLRFDKPVIVF